MMRLSIIFVLLFCTFSVVGQQQKIDVNKDINLAKVYEQLVKEGYGTPKIYLELANAHYFDSNYVQAKKWFEKVFQSQETVNDVIVFRYKQSLKALNLDIIENNYLIGTN